MLSYSINDQLLSQLVYLNNKIDNKLSILMGLSDKQRDEIHQLARVSQVGASTRIENAILTDAEVLWVDTTLANDARKNVFKSYEGQIIDKLSKDRERSIEEVMGCRSMLFLIYEQAKEMLPLTESTLRGLHAELLGFYPKAKHYLGQYKTVTNSVVEINHKTKEQKVVFKTADPGPVTNSAMTDLVAWYNQNINQYPFSLAVAVELVFRFLAIHPFQDGNGRLGRGLFMLTLLQSPNQSLSQVARYVAIDRQIERHKEEYYYVLQKTSGGRYLSNPKKYQFEFFLKFMLKIFDLALNDIDYYIERVKLRNELSESAMSVLKCMKDFPEKKMQTKDIIAQTKLPRRTVNYALTNLLKINLIQKYGKGPGTVYQVVF